MARFEIQTRIAFDWENTWTDDNGQPITFATRQEAEKELAEFLSDLEDSYKCGDLIDPYDPEDFRIEAVNV